MREALLYFWQLPQNLAGVLLLFLFGGGYRNEDDGIVWYHTNRMTGGISLGNYIIMGAYNRTALRHEYGHQMQSLLLGWLYLPVVGIPSLLWAFLYGTFINKTPNGYYRFFTERWADELAGIERE